MKRFLNELIKRVIANKITICILLVTIVLLGIIVNKALEENYNSSYTYNTYTEGAGRTPSIKSGENITQNFITTRNKFCQIGIYSLMPGISTNSNVNVKIIETKTNKEIFNQNIFLGELKSDSYFEIKIPEQAKSKNKEYQIIVTGIDGDDLNSIQFPYSSYPNNLLEKSTINEEEQENNLMVKVIYNDQISLKKQVAFWIALFIVALIFVLVFLSDKELIFKNLNLDGKVMLKNLKDNWYWIFPIIAFYIISLRTTKLEYIFLIFSVLIDIFILTQVKSLKEKLKNIDFKIKILAIISAIGTCYYAKILFAHNFLELNLEQYIKAETVISTVVAYILIFKIILYILIGLAFFIVFLIDALILNYIVQKLKNLFENIPKKEKLFYIIFILLIFVYITYAFSNSTAFSGTEDVLFDVLFTSDSGRLVTDENVYLSIYHGENDLRQPLFALFAMPFVGGGYTISLCLPFVQFSGPLCMNFVQVLLFFIANLMLAKLFNLKPIERCAFIVLSFCTYMSLLFILMMEQYLIAYFWLITFIYLACNKKQDEVALVGAGGTLLTSFALAPFIVNDFSFKKIKKFFLKLTKAGVVAIVFLIVVNRVDIIENLFTKQQDFNGFIDSKITLEYKLREYTIFVRNCFVYPQTYVNTESIMAPYSLQVIPNSSYSIIGIGLIIAAILGFFLNKKDKLSIISFYWVIISYIIIGIIGWGTAENGTILYSLYFGWAYLVLIYKLLQYFCNKIKIKNIFAYVTIILIVVMCVINFEGVKELLDFAFTYYGNGG